MPAAPASRQMSVLARVTPPRARTGMGAAARQAARSRSRPEPVEILLSAMDFWLGGDWAPAFSKTGPNRMRVGRFLWCGGCGADLRRRGCGRRG